MSTTLEPQASLFPKTPWTQLMRLRGGDAVAQDMLAQVCRLYWYPVYAYIRGRGQSVHDAEDHTQEFFMSLLKRDDLSVVNRERGRLRDFLLASIKNFLNYAWRRDSALKRGGGHDIVSFDVEWAEQRLQNDFIDHADPEKLFERRWAVTLLETVLQDLRTEHERAGKAKHFQALSPFLSWTSAAPDYAAAATALTMQEGAVRVAVHRLRKRYRDLLHEHIASTVESPDEVDGELDHLLRVFAE